MKVTKIEKIWLIAVVFFYLAYNLPFVPGYNDARGTILHGILTLVPLWICVYVGLFKTFRIHRLKERKGEKDA